MRDSVNPPAANVFDALRFGRGETGGGGAQEDSSAGPPGIRSAEDVSHRGAVIARVGAARGCFAHPTANQRFSRIAPTGGSTFLPQDLLDPRLLGRGEAASRGGGRPAAQEYE